MKYLQHITKFIFILMAWHYGMPMYAQISVGVNGSTVSVAPSNTVTNNTTIHITGLIKNTGTVSITDYLHINLAIDTSTTSTPKYYWRSTVTYSVTNFLPNTTHTFVISDLASTTNKYKAGLCCGTTIVVWPLVGNPTNTVSTNDSASTVVYITLPVPTNTDDLNGFEANPLILKNPLNENVLLNYNETIYNQIELMGLDGQIVPDAIENKMLYVSYLSKGLYFLRLYRSDTGRFITKKIVIE